jgi:nitrate/nitrite transport system substrate-binding protein
MDIRSAFFYCQFSSRGNNMNWKISLTQQIKSLLLGVSIGASLCINTVSAEVGFPEKEELRFGFIKLTDMAPIAVAYEKGYFEEEGLYVTIEA